jgi:hypothetical protein
VVPVQEGADRSVEEEAFVFPLFVRLQDLSREALVPNAAVWRVVCSTKRLVAVGWEAEAEACAISDRSSWVLL